MKRIGNLSILFNYTTLGDPPFEFKGTAWTEVVFRHGREREGGLSARDGCCQHGSCNGKQTGKGSCHGRFLSGTTPRVNSTRNAHFHGGDSLPFSILSLLTMANRSRIPNALSHPRTWLKSILSMDLLHLSICRDDHH